jgi:hypothetical protein
MSRLGTKTAGVVLVSLRGSTFGLGQRLLVQALGRASEAMKLLSSPPTPHPSIKT